jgi:DNA-binding MarR family transcriptional regulator
MLEVGTMSSASPTDANRVEALLVEMARVGAHSVLFSEAVAARAGINSTDLESLDILRREGPMTAGRLAELTGLSTGGAITALIDRLERLGYARREPDAHDRRRVIVRALAEQAERDLGPLYAALDRAIRDLIAQYDNNEIVLLLDFFTRTNDVMQQQIARIRATPAAGPNDEPVASEPG